MVLEDIRIVFMGTPEFAVYPMRAILNAGYEVAAVITAPDKPAGRGRALSQSPVKQFAVENGIRVLQPVKLKDPEFLQELASLRANLQVVVAFRMLPEVVWQMPSLGTFNLHASLLPDYRGAAPINWAIINGEKETGLTTFFLSHEIDTGNIILQERMPVYDDDDAGSLHDRMAVAGSRLVVQTLDSIKNQSFTLLSQDSLFTNGATIKAAPKIFKPDCRISWHLTADQVYNLVRGLSPYPAAFTSLISPQGETVSMKIFKTRIDSHNYKLSPGSISTDGKHFFKVAAADAMIELLEVQLEGKKRMGVGEFLRGFALNEQWKTS